MAAEHSGKTAVITGAARGFGKTFARALVERGAKVALIDVDAEAVEQTAAEIGASATSYVGDVTDEGRMRTILDAFAQAHGGIDILINNAGLHAAKYNQTMTALGLAEVRKLFDVNVMGVIIGSLAARDAMRNRPDASIVNISSTASYGCHTAYGVSKLAVRGLTITLARELAEDQIRVNAIAPGQIFTDTIRTQLSPENVAWVRNQQILKREGEERDILEALLYLVSDRAAFVTGETLRVSGGFTTAI